MDYSNLVEQRFYNSLKDIYRLVIKNTTQHQYLEQADFFIKAIHTEDDDIYFMLKQKEKEGLVVNLPFSKRGLTDLKISKILSLGEKNDVYVSVANFYPSLILSKKEIDDAKSTTDISIKRKIYNSEVKIPRLASNATSVDAIIIDIDYYKLFALSFCTPEEVYDKIEEELFKNMDFKPHFTIFSGRGLQLVFLIKNVQLFMDYENQRMYKEVVYALVKLLSRYGSDPACSDLSRVFRLPGTINSMSLKRAYILKFDNVKNESFCRYSLKDLHDKFCNNLIFEENFIQETSTKTKVSAKVLKLNSGTKRKYNLGSKGLKNILIARSKNFRDKCSDLKGWLTEHNGDIDGKRNVFFDIYASCLIYWVFDENMQLEHLKLINNILKNPLSSYDLIRILNNSRKFRYRYSKKTIMDKLNFTNKDFIGKKVLFILTAEEKEKKKKEKYDMTNELRRQSRCNENGLTEKAQKKADNFSIIKNLMDEDKSINEIIQITGLKKSSVYSYIKEIKQSFAS